MKINTPNFFYFIYFFIFYIIDKRPMFFSGKGYKSFMGHM